MLAQTIVANGDLPILHRFLPTLTVAPRCLRKLDKLAFSSGLSQILRRITRRWLGNQSISNWGLGPAAGPRGPGPRPGARGHLPIHPQNRHLRRAHTHNTLQRPPRPNGVDVTTDGYEDDDDDMFAPRDFVKATLPTLSDNHATTIHNGFLTPPGHRARAPSLVPGPVGQAPGPSPGGSPKTLKHAEGTTTI